MPPHSLHLLQPLDVVPYSLLKRHYSDRISLLACSCIYYINKETFLLAFKVAFKRTFTLENVCVVLLKLDVQLRTPTPPALGTVA
ncbi:uncharacterized protein M421DRAFT_420784 [Didymella exigua CBS 183.55]|uniref:DDE-1 domain-containing protein n=1 Tax=Didymella exigua CBS 183.55 TaxID=1150837 RepID=A0A6A5RIR7_9PLEO|nr:uncharacterized protein M421DRAFT_420784 [Didymella exigua CBS 183.55]KAF1928245.1 hypothetical protein M421DRAFT_420784 [Didymella exigua CBS 183.55]